MVGWLVLSAWLAFGLMGFECLSNMFLLLPDFSCLILKFMIWEDLTHVISNYDGGRNKFLQISATIQHKGKLLQTRMFQTDVYRSESLLSNIIDGNFRLV